MSGWGKTTWELNVLKIVYKKHQTVERQAVAAAVILRPLPRGHSIAHVLEVKESEKGKVNRQKAQFIAIENCSKSTNY